jgi:hypothetical protein
MKSAKAFALGIEVLLLSLWANPALTRSSGQGQSAPALLSPEMLVEDFSVFRHALEEAHPGAYRYTSRAEFDTLFDGIATKLDQPMSEQDFYRALNPAIVALRCGHTKFHPERNFATPYNYGLEKQLPLVLFIAHRRAFVQADLSPAPSLPAGSELLEIDGVAMEAIIEQLLNRVSFADGNGIGAKVLELNTYFSAYYSTFIGSAPRYEVTYRVPGATDTTTASLSGISHQVHVAWQQGQRADAPLLELTFPDEATALLTIRSFWFESRQVNFERFLRDTFSEIAARDVERLVIDLRDNEGGKDAYGALLFSYLTDRPFRYYDRITVTQRRPFSFREHARLPWYFPLYRMLIRKAPDGSFIWTHHSNLRVRKPQPGAYFGDVTVLINGRSFSVTSEFAAIAKANGRATFVGQETSGGYRGNNSGFFAIVTLPNSRLVTGIPLWGYYTAVSNPAVSDGGVRPDIPVERTIQDVLSGRDPELERALALIHSGD